MKTSICNKLGIETPIFAFSHCRDVVAAACKSGGFGVFGASRYTPEELEIELSWIDAHCDGKPYGIDVVFPQTYDKRMDEPNFDPYSMIPESTIKFYNDFFEKEGVPPLPPDEKEKAKTAAARILRTRGAAARLIELALGHPNVKLIVNALGVPSRETVNHLHQRGVLVGSLVGAPRHAEKQIEAGVDVLVAQGFEAGGHTGSISTLVLVPQIVDVARDKAAVLAAGGIGRGSQLVAMLALGAQGVWCGSIWLCTSESNVPPGAKEAMLAAKSGDTLQVYYKTGKTVRTLRSKLSDAMRQPDAPPPLKAPLQAVLFDAQHARAVRANRFDVSGPTVGQMIGAVTEERSVRQIYHDMVNEAAEVAEHLDHLLFSRNRS